MTVDELRTKAKNGDIDALYKLGLIFSEGDYFENDMFIGAKCLYTAAQKGHPLAQQAFEKQKNREFGLSVMLELMIQDGNMEPRL